jgi:NTP pyrophosphatase (non-canonical NTP hydrolase)
MELNVYQDLTKETAIYPKEHALVYLGLGLSSEAGEVAGKIKKQIRDGGIDVISLMDEVGDVFWYLARICDEMGFSSEDVLLRNWNKLRSRKERGVIGGSGDNR